jgi:hypothetical protein
VGDVLKLGRKVMGKEKRAFEAMRSSLSDTPLTPVAQSFWKASSQGKAPRNYQLYLLLLKIRLDISWKGDYVNLD